MTRVTARLNRVDLVGIRRESLSRGAATPTRRTPGQDRIVLPHPNCDGLRNGHARPEERLVGFPPVRDLGTAFGLEVNFPVLGARPLSGELFKLTVRVHSLDFLVLGGEFPE